MKDYLYSIVISVLVFAVFNLFITKTKNGKLVKSIISLIVNLVSNKSLDNFNFSDEDYLTHLERVEEESQKSYVKSLLLKANVDVKKVEINREENKVKNVKVVISSNSSHIDITKVVLDALKDVVDKGVEVIVETQ